jgi:long-chain acyl-CoA synthetase
LVARGLCHGRILRLYLARQATCDMTPLENVSAESLRFRRQLPDKCAACHRLVGCADAKKQILPRMEKEVAEQLDTLEFSEVASIAEVFCQRVQRSPERIAYFDYDPAVSDWQPTTWAEAGLRAGRIRAGFERDGLPSDARAAIMLRNCSMWCIFDQAALAHGMVTVPLFVDDRPDNIAYILNDAGVDVILVENEEHVKKLLSVAEQLTRLKLILTWKPVKNPGDARVQHLEQWMSAGPTSRPVHKAPDFDGRKALATIVYTSGTTGKAKGVMLSHRNMLANAQSCLGTYDIYPQDRFLSFLPLSHMFERTVGYYFTMVTGSEVSFARSIPQLSEDFRRVRPSIIVSVPRIFERLHSVISDQLRKAPPTKKRMFDLASRIGWARFEHQQGRGGWSPSFLLWPVLKRLVANKLLDRLGGRLRLCISGGAALNPTIAHTFLGLGLPICQGYGLTEAAPVCSVNLLHKNDPASIGPPLPGVQVALGNNNALLVKGDNVMMGYWNRPEDTARVLSSNGWLDTGDQARLENGFIYITGRIKDIIVMGNGEKVPPVDMELAIQLDPLLEQVMIVGEAKPFLSALVVLNTDEWFKVAEENGLVADPNGENRDRAERLVVARIAAQLKSFPGYAQVRKVVLITEKWTVDNGLLTPTMKLKRAPIIARYQAQIDARYRGHLAG